MKVKIYLIGIGLVLLASCSPKLIITNGEKVESTIKSDDIYVFGENQRLPIETEIIGNIRTKGNMFTSSKYRTDEVVKLIKNGAKQLNGNAVRIIKINFPKSPFTSHSYDMEAEVLMIKTRPSSIFEIVNHDTKNEGYLVYLYRPNRFFGANLSYPVFLNQYFVGGLNNNERIIIKLKDKTKNYYLEIEAYGERFKIPIIIKEDRLVIMCNINKNGRPKIDIKYN